MWDLVDMLLDLGFWTSIGRSVGGRRASDASAVQVDGQAWLASASTLQRARPVHEPVDRLRLRTGRAILFATAVAIVGLGLVAAFLPGTGATVADTAHGIVAIIPVIVGPFFATVAALGIGAVIAVLAAAGRLDITLRGAAITLVVGVVGAGIISLGVFAGSLLPLDAVRGLVAGTDAAAEAATAAVQLSLQTWALPPIVGVGWTLLVGCVLASTETVGRTTAPWPPAASPDAARERAPRPPLRRRRLLIAAVGTCVIAVAALVAGNVLVVVRQPPCGWYCDGDLTLGHGTVYVGMHYGDLPAGRDDYVAAWHVDGLHTTETILTRDPGYEASFVVPWRDGVAVIAQYTDNAKPALLWTMRDREPWVGPIQSSIPGEGATPVPRIATLWSEGLLLAGHRASTDRDVYVPAIWTSADGARWRLEPMPAEVIPAGSPGGTITGVWQGGDGIVIGISPLGGEPRQQAWTSPDLRSWRAMGDSYRCAWSFPMGPYVHEAGSDNCPRVD